MNTLQSVVFKIGRNFTPCIVKSAHRNYSSSTDLIWPIREQLMHCQLLASELGELEDVCDVGYIDTMHESSRIPKETLKKVRTILFLGNEHFSDNLNMLKELQRNFFEPLTQNNCRVVMPFSIGSKHTQTDNVMMYDNQFLSERAQFLVDFICGRGLRKIDLFIGHSMAAFVTMAVRMNFHNATKLALICPLPGNTAPRWIQPGWLSFRMMVRYHRLLFYPLTRAWISRVRRLMGKELMGSQFTNEEAHHLAKVAHGLNYQTIRNLAVTIPVLKIPTLYMGCRDDPVVNRVQEKEFLELMGLTESDFVQYNEDFEVQGGNPGEKYGVVRGVRLPGGSHYPFQDKKSSEIMVQEILRLLDNNSGIDKQK